MLYQDMSWEGEDFNIPHSSQTLISPTGFRGLQSLGSVPLQWVLPL